MKRSAVEGLLAYCRSMHPEEGILLLRGESNKDSIIVKELVFAPIPLTGEDFASFRSDLLPLDFSIIGVAHSHPSGVLKPSSQDLSSYYGRIMVIVGYPYQSEDDLAVFDRDGLESKFHVQ